MHKISILTLKFKWRHFRFLKIWASSIVVTQPYAVFEDPHNFTSVATHPLTS